MGRVSGGLQVREQDGISITNETSRYILMLIYVLDSIYLYNIMNDHVLFVFGTSGLSKTITEKQLEQKSFLIFILYLSKIAYKTLHLPFIQYLLFSCYVYCFVKDASICKGRAM